MTDEDNVLDIFEPAKDITEEELSERRKRAKEAGEEIERERIKKEEERYEKEKKSKREYYIKNSELIRKRSSNWYINNIEIARKKSNKRYRDNPERHWSVTNLNRHKSRGYIIQITSDELFEKLVVENKKCQICGCDLNFYAGTKEGKSKPDSPTLDRMNNENEIRKDNILILCFKCNSMKQDLTLEEYAIHCEKFIKKYENGDFNG